MKILITGATGFVGQNLCERLLQEGHEVWALVRNPQKLASFKRSPHILQGDLEDPSGNDWSVSLPQDLQMVIHSAGLVHSFQHEAFYKINTQGTRLLLDKLRKGWSHSPLHFILISSLAAAGPATLEKSRTEKDLPSPVGHYGKSKLAGEKILQEFSSPNWTTSILRPPIVMGPGDQAVLDIFKMVRKGFFLCAGSGGEKKVYSFVCVLDLVEFIFKLMQKSPLEREREEIYFVGHPQTISYGELIETIREALGKKKLRKVTLTLEILRPLSIILAYLNKVVPVPLRLTPDKLNEIQEDYWTCSPSKSIENLDMHYQWDLTQTISKSLEDYQLRGL